MADTEDLASRLRRISDLTDALTKVQHDNAEAHALAVQISREIAAARRQIQQLPPLKK